MRRKLFAVIVAFAMAFTVIPTAVSSAGENTEPTLSAPEMTEGSDTQTDEEQGGNTEHNTDTEITMSQDTASEDPATENASEETSSSEETSTTTTKPEVTTTTINTSGKKWKTPKGNKTLSLTICRDSYGIVFDLMEQAGQTLYAYDTLQGAAAGKGYAYFSLYNRKKTNAKIVKVRLYDMKVMKVSGVLDIRHANEIAYNGRKNILVVANADPTPKRVSVIDANTLRVRYHKTLKIKGKVKGMSKKERKKFKGVGAIAYNEKHNCYICRTRKTNNLLFLDANLKPYRQVKQKAKVKGMLYQGMDSYKDCVMICQSFKGKKKYNLITVYNMKGKKLARFTMSLGKPVRELETIFHNGNQFYVGCYSSYGAKADLQKLHVKRENYIYRINNL